MAYRPRRDRPSPADVMSSGSVRSVSLKFNSAGLFRPSLKLDNRLIDMGFADPHICQNGRKWLLCEEFYFSRDEAQTSQVQDRAPIRMY